ncbi:MAG TPA: TAT-variant-translocated molybdopterin oxidoreductase, partial [Tepidisphaeraceae bacterium]|nr:TAT-variant-translocated molybdopterin oxidoreductase [Tepidisphaeraceae bacterium]
MTENRSTISLAMFPAKGKPLSGVAKNSALFPMRLWRDEAERNGRFAAGEAVHNEFADGASAWPDDLSRRNFLKIAGASLAAGALAGGCDYVPETKIVPYVNPPAAVVPGQPTFYATSMPISGFGFGVLVESHEGRPTKIEGNPDHPASLGRTNVYMQASVLQLYDPARAREVMFAGESSTWDLFLANLQDRLAARQSAGGKGVALLIGRTTSPTLLSVLAEFQRRYPAARIHLHEPVGRDVSGDWPIYKFENAKVILSLDSDFLFEEPGSVHYAMKFADSRRVRQDRTDISRLYMVEATYSMTGSMADHRQPVKSSEVAAIAAAVAKELGVGGIRPNLPPPPDRLQAWIATVAADLRRAGAGALVVPGMFQSVEVHTLAAAINRMLGSAGKCVEYYRPETEPANIHSRSQLLEDMRSGATDTLLILGGNPAYDTPADLHFADALEQFSRAKAADDKGYRNLSAHLGLYYDETAFRCQWHLPESHYLESWGDLRAYEGSASIVQPLILPLYPSKSAIELLDRMLGRYRGGYEIVRGHWMANQPSPSFDAWWQETLRKGVIPGSAPHAQTEPTTFTPSMPAPAPVAHPAGENTVEIIFRPDPTVYDGAFSSLGWLQECPKPFTKLTWDNAVLIGPAMARKLQLIDDDMVRLTLRGESLECAVLVLPGQADGTITLHLGYGRSRGAGEVGNWRGFDANRLRFSDAPWFAA